MKGICSVAFSYRVHFGAANLVLNYHDSLTVCLPTNLKFTTLHTYEPNILAIICIQTVMQKCLAVLTAYYPIH